MKRQFKTVLHFRDNTDNIFTPCTVPYGGLEQTHEHPDRARMEIGTIQEADKQDQEQINAESSETLTG